MICAASEDELQKICEDELKKGNMKINASKTKVIVIEK